MAAQDHSAALNYVIQEELTIQKSSAKRKRNDVGMAGNQRLYQCKWCVKIDHAGNLNRHMHNSCKSRPAKWKCESCPLENQVDFKAKTLQEVLNHYNLNHAETSFWTCPACIKPIKQANFVQHFCSMTNAGKVKYVFKGFKTETDYKMSHNHYLSDFITIKSSNEYDSPEDGAAKINDRNELYKLSIACITHPTDEFTY